MKSESAPWKIWAISGVNFLMAGYFAVIMVAVPMAVSKSQMQSFYYVHRAKTDRALDVLATPQFGSWFVQYNLLLLVFAPLLIARLRWNPWIKAVVLLLLWLPVHWYGNHILHLSGKIIDWAAWGAANGLE